MSEHHWSRARQGQNEEALQYLRERSHAPGVEAGGSERNFYCMSCDGVIPYSASVASCPHCGAKVEGVARRYFNWVEINEPPRSDVRALLPFAVAGLVLVIGLVAWWFLA